MSRYFGWLFTMLVMLAVSAPLQALNYEVGGCKTGSGYVNFTTISAAVAGVPAGSTIQVCPGVYPEQVTITQPLTLLVIRSGNSNRAVITINPNGNLAPNVTSVIGEGKGVRPLRFPARGGNLGLETIRGDSRGRKYEGLSQIGALLWHSLPRILALRGTSRKTALS